MSDIADTINHLEYKWFHKWRYKIDEETHRRIGAFALPFTTMMAEILESNNIDEKTSKQLGDRLAAYTSLSFVAGLEFGKLVGPVDLDLFFVNVSTKTAYEKLPMGEQLTKHLVASYFLDIGNLLGSEIVRSYQQKIIEMLVLVLVEFFKAGLQVSSYY